ncbi:MAG: site-specific DNA-methyltransferase [Pseudomonadota bacterium]
MQTDHQLIFQNAGDMHPLIDNSIDLIATSPPYPMIEMWDSQFVKQDQTIGRAMEKGHGMAAFEGMHRLLDPVWHEAYRVLKPGGFICINIGDATRTLDSNFILYPNHSRILSCLVESGFTPLPLILWRKQTNAPNKFMGSGMLPAGAYITLEHEYILIARKGPKREFSRPERKKARRESALFWEERNTWFSDIWMDLKGARQCLGDETVRKRSASFPFELPYRLISMYSVKEDTVLDPFMGLGTTALAAMAAGRSSVGFELEKEFLPAIQARFDSLIPFAGGLVQERLERHRAFMDVRVREKGVPKHKNLYYGFPVVTSQERELFINRPLALSISDETLSRVTYEPVRVVQDRQETGLVQKPAEKPEKRPGPSKSPVSGATQLNLFD